MAAPEDTSNLSLQEQEMLAYLEDLQQNNPAEYDLLVQQMREQKPGGAAGGGGGGAGGGEGEQVVPRPGFVAKTVSATGKGMKVFINVCQSEHVDPPAPMEANNPAEEMQYRIPMSLGPPREDLDKDGAVCMVYDVVFHPETVENALAQQEFRDFVMQLTLYQIAQKYKDELQAELKFPKVKGNYKGVAPLPQVMRKKGTPPPRPPDVAGETTPSGDRGAAAAGGGGKIQEVDADDEPSPEQLPAPAYAVDPRVLREGGAGSGADGADPEPDGLCVKAHLPECEHADEVDVRLGAEVLELHVARKYALSVQLPQPVEPAALGVKFEARRRILSVTLRLAPASSRQLDGAPAATPPRAEPASAAAEATEAKGGFEGEMARRVRERASREKAAARRAQARRAVASGEAPAVGSGAAGGGGDSAAAGARGQAAEEEEEERIVDVTEEAAGGGEGERGGAASPAAAADGGKEGGVDKGKKRSVMLEISNSIIDEIED